jgi:hypothetical protein
MPMRVIIFSVSLFVQWLGPYETRPKKGADEQEQQQKETTFL